MVDFYYRLLFLKIRIGVLKIKVFVFLFYKWKISKKYIKIYLFFKNNYVKKLIIYGSISRN